MNLRSIVLVAAAWICTMHALTGAAIAQHTLEQRIQQKESEIAEAVAEKGENSGDVEWLKLGLNELLKIKHDREMRDAEHAPRSESPFDRVISIDFKGGTVQDYIDALSGALGERRIVALLQEERVPFAPVKLDSVQLGSAVRVLHGYSARSADGRSVNLEVLSDRDVYTVRLSYPRGASENPKVTCVWTIDWLLDSGLKTEDVLSAVQAALAMLPDPGTVSFHPETRLIMMRASEEQGRTINTVLDRLESGIKSKVKMKDAEKLSAKIDELNRIIASLQVQLAQEQETVRQLKDQPAGGRSEKPRDH